MDIMGVDEAGRGPVLGPMVIGGIVIPEKMNIVLERMGVKDSKKLTPERRAILARKLSKMFDYDTVVISAKDIDNLRAKGVNLNDIEKLGMLKVIRKLNADEVIIDSFDIKELRFQNQIQRELGDDIKVIAKNKADDTYVQVGAASIMAKVTRDNIIADLNKDYKDMGGIGSGYPSDPHTQHFLSKFTYDELPDFVRRSWNTVKKMKDDESQMRF
ncbi:ribonuclease HII [Methanobrevibacter sp. 87.7]|uniref:ribonuclease HII n=1 Tax=Methanobrevibacter sp. 87.7 TaxID=387957 RepID=UPI000B4FEE04|nr:ribonuclease HII [Methanobrevibacter sp. 87.7]OWT33145.1 ribonuclease HII [Methanobrevibacter sp. 87.7]